MSFAYDKAAEILKNPERWVADEGGSRIVVVYKNRQENYSIAEIMNSNPPYLTETIENTLWFRTVDLARQYAKKEMYVEARFKKAK
ncbi:hypothetical protein [Paenibacillus sp. FSL E2-0177]|uniref:hypothetical protein n=1 Tax=Paenibacillus sp. FSL E2-0177 TaxID=2921360 RepID=UPI0030EF7705